MVMVEGIYLWEYTPTGCYTAYPGGERSEHSCDRHTLTTLCTLGQPRLVTSRRNSGATISATPSPRRRQGDVALVIGRDHKDDSRDTPKGAE